MVEFAIVLPVLLLLVVGIIEFGRAYNVSVSLTGAAREGARALALGDDPEAATKAAAPTLQPEKITVTTSGNPCTTGSPATVTASYPFTFNVLIGKGDITIEQSGVMRCGG